MSSACWIIRRESSRLRGTRNCGRSLCSKGGSKLMEFDFRSTRGGRFILGALAFPKELDLFGRAEAGAREFGVGIEEEYFLSDIHTMQVACETSDSLFELASAGLPGRIDREFLQSQVETATTPHS